MNMAGVERLELPTFGFGIRGSTNWSYTPMNSKKGDYTSPLFLLQDLFQNLRNNTRTYCTTTFTNREA